MWIGAMVVGFLAGIFMVALANSEPSSGYPTVRQGERRQPDWIGPGWIGQSVSLYFWREQGEADVVPDGWGVAYHKWNAPVAVIMPVPLHWIVRIARDAYSFLRFAGSVTRWQLHALAVVESRLVKERTEARHRGYKEGRKDGYEEGRASVRREIRYALRDLQADLRAARSELS